VRRDLEVPVGQRDQPHDGADGELAVFIDPTQQQVIVGFRLAVSRLALDPTAARNLAALLLLGANQLEGKPNT
jgi:hypothetical protein